MLEEIQIQTQKKSIFDYVYTQRHDTPLYRVKKKYFYLITIHFELPPTLPLSFYSTPLVPFFLCLRIDKMVVLKDLPESKKIGSKCTFQSHLL